MKRIYITLISIVTLATAIAQLQNSLPASVQLFMKDRSEGFFKQTSPMRGAVDSKRSAYAPPYQMNGVEVVDAFIDIADQSVIESLKAQGVIVNCEFDGFITAQIPVHQLETVSTMNGVTDVEISKMLDVYIPGVEQMQTELKKYDAAFAQEETLKKENETLKAKVEEKKRKGLEEQLRETKLEHDYQEAVSLLQRIPPEILEEYRHPGRRNREVHQSVER